MAYLPPLFPRQAAQMAPLSMTRAEPSLATPPFCWATAAFSKTAGSRRHLINSDGLPIHSRKGLITIAQIQLKRHASMLRAPNGYQSKTLPLENRFTRLLPREPAVARKNFNQFLPHRQLDSLPPLDATRKTHQRGHRFNHSRNPSCSMS
jgi:hypothetical protein